MCVSHVCHKIDFVSTILATDSGGLCRVEWFVETRIHALGFFSTGYGRTVDLRLGVVTGASKPDKELERAKFT